MTDTDPIVFVVDDDNSVRKSLARLIRSMGLNVETFASADAFLDRNPYEGPACLILDVRMPGLSGLDLQKELTASGQMPSIIFLTGHGNIPMSVQAMKAGAVEFLEKPVEDQVLLDAVHQAIQKDYQFSDTPGAPGTYTRGYRHVE
jgi:FixJ family two-component response regulator